MYLQSQDAPPKIVRLTASNQIGNFMKYLTVSEILSVASPIPFHDTELQVLLQTMKQRRAKNHDLGWGCPGFVDEYEDWKDRVKQGVLFVHSAEQLGVGFLFLKFGAGNSFFGKEKFVYPCYLQGDRGADAWLTGPTYKSWWQAVTSIGNVYRGHGF